MIDALLSVVLFSLLYTGIGLFVSRWLSVLDQTKHARLPQHLAQAFLLGAGITTYLEFLFSTVAIPFRFTLFAVSVFGFFGWKRILPRLMKEKALPTKRQLFFWVPILSVLVLLATRALSRVIYAFDSLAFWIPKMMALYHDQIVLVQGLIKFNHPQYPLLLPMIGANVFTLLNKPDVIAVKAVIFLFTIAIVVMIGSFLLSKHTLIKSLFWIMLLLSLFIFREHVAGEYIGTADIFVGIYLAAGSIALIQKRPATAVVFWLLSAWSKSEGLVFVLVSMSLLLLFYKRLRPYIIGMAAAFIVPWQLLMKFFKVDTSQYFKFDEIYARPWVEYAVYSVHAFREEFRNIEKWNLVFFLFLSTVLTHIRKIFKDKALFTIITAMTAQLVMYMVIFTVTPEEQASFIAASVSRLTLHLAPTALIVSATLLSRESNGQT